MASSKPPPPARPNPATDPARVFDRRLHSRRRARAAGGFAGYAFLKQAAARDLAERLTAVNRTFDLALDLGGHGGEVERAVRQDPGSADRVTHFVRSDIAPAFATRACLGEMSIAADEEALPFREAAFDLVVSALSLHWINDLPGALIQIRRTLKPDGLFMGALLGGRTLSELRKSLLTAETELRGGAARRVSPFLDVIDGAGLLQRAGFAMPVTDSHRLTVRYADPLRLLYDLRGMGETAAPADRDAPALTRGVLARALEVYQERFSDPDGRVRATFEIVTLSGWAPGEGQPKPKRPGSATARLSDALGVTEQKLPREE